MDTSYEMDEYIRSQWHLEGEEYDDECVMLWVSGFRAEAVWLLVDNGAFSFEPDSAPKEVNIEAKCIYKDMPRSEVESAIAHCLDPETGDYRAIECPECKSVEFLNSLYWDGIKEWPCHSCGQDTKGMKFVKTSK